MRLLLAALVAGAGWFALMGRSRPSNRQGRTDGHPDHLHDINKHGHNRSERQHEEDARGQKQGNDAVIDAGARVSRTLELLLQEYKTRNAQADRERPENQANQRSVVRWAGVATIIAGAALATAAWQSYLVQGQLRAALTTNRAWVSIDPQVSSALTFGPFGGSFELAVNLKNIGHSPATGVSVAAKGSVLVSGRGYSWVEILTDVCKDAEKNTASPIMLFPDESHSVATHVRIAQDDLMAGIIGSTNRGDRVIPHLYVCAVYTDAGGGFAARTAFAYSIGVRGDRPGSMLTVPAYGTVQPDTLVVRRDFIGGGLAD